MYLAKEYNAWSLAISVPAPKEAFVLRPCNNMNYYMQINNNGVFQLATTFPAGLYIIPFSYFAK